MAERLLDVESLRVSFITDEGIVQAVDEVSFTVDSGEVLAIVGESGCGKSVTAMTLMGLTRLPNARFSGSAKLRGEELLTAPERRMRQIRGGEIAMIFQDPMSALNPVQRVGDQIVEQIRAHEQVAKRPALEAAIAAMERVGIPRARERARAFPHEFSGGMRQRVMIAMALSCSPSLLIADEPTTALDVTIQAQILELMKRLQRDYGSSILLITHDMGVVSDLAERVTVMYAGSVVEEGPKASVFRDPQHPYTWGLLGSIPRVGRPRVRRLAAIPGAPPSLLAPPEGCRFAPRCRHRFDKCGVRPELLERVAAGRADACHLEPAARPMLRLDQESA